MPTAAASAAPPRTAPTRRRSRIRTSTPSSSRCRRSFIASWRSRALAAGKHVLVEKPAFPTLADYETVREARTRAGRVVMVGENDHYKPLA